MYKIEYTTRFRQDLKKIAKRSQDDFYELEMFVEHLCECGFYGIDTKYKPHYLKGN